MKARRSTAAAGQEIEAAIVEHAVLMARLAASVAVLVKRLRALRRRPSVVA